jgi:hypothetical protein
MFCVLLSLQEVVWLNIFINKSVSDRMKLSLYNSQLWQVLPAGTGRVEVVVSQAPPRVGLLGGVDLAPPGRVGTNLT